MMRPIEPQYSNKLVTMVMIGSVFLTVLSVWYWQRAPAQDTLLLQSAPNWDGPVGAGTLRAAPGEQSAPVLFRQASSPLPLTIDADGHLKTDLALRRLIDSFLANGPLAERQQRALDLRTSLKSTLVAPASNEADHIVTIYLDYLDAQDRFLARERLPAPAASGLTESGVEHLLAWQEQRRQLRQRLLGVELTQTWFATDDARCASVLRDWIKQFGSADPSAETDLAELRERRLHGPALEAIRAADAQSCAAQISQGFAERAN